MPGEQKKLIIQGYIIKRYIKILLLEKDKGRKMAALTKGVLDGVFTPLSKVFS